MLPMIAVPTTAGTGSECQSFALISDADTHVKMACGDPKAAAKIAILDPELTVSQPHRVTVCTGIDALSHALESAVTTKRNAWSAVFSREAFRLCHSGFSRVSASPATWTRAGRCCSEPRMPESQIENSMLGAAHSCANPLTAYFDVVHGEAVGAMLPHIIRYNAALPEIAALYQSYFDGDLADRITELLAKPRCPCSSRTTASPKPMRRKLAAMAAKQWTAQFNPRPVSEADFAELFQAAL